MPRAWDSGQGPWSPPGEPQVLRQDEWARRPAWVLATSTGTAAARVPGSPPAPAAPPGLPPHLGVLACPRRSRPRRQGALPVEGISPPGPQAPREGGASADALAALAVSRVCGNSARRRLKCCGQRGRQWAACPPACPAPGSHHKLGWRFLGAPRSACVWVGSTWAPTRGRSLAPPLAPPTCAPPPPQHLLVSGPVHIKCLSGVRTRAGPSLERGGPAASVPGVGRPARSRGRPRCLCPEICQPDLSGAPEAVCPALQVRGSPAGSTTWTGRVVTRRLKSVG